MKVRTVIPMLAALLLTGSLTNAATTPQDSMTTASMTEDTSVLFAPVSTGCAEATSSAAEPTSAGPANPMCGNCSFNPSCRGVSFGRYCGGSGGQFSTCQPVNSCVGEGLGYWLCVCTTHAP